MGILKTIGNAITGGLPSLISGGISLIGSAVGNKSGLKQQQLANEGNMRLAQYKYEKDLEQWNRENEYNSPKSQMQRYAEAGLNPNLIYGQGSSGNAASSAPTYDAPHLEAYRNFGDMGAAGAVQAFQNQQALTAQTALMESQRAKIASEVKGIELGNIIKNLDAASKEWKLGLDKKYGEEGVRAALQASWKNIHLMDSQQQLNLANAGVANAKENLLIKQREHEVAKIGLTRAQTALARSRIQEVGANVELIRKKAAELQYELSTNPDPKKFAQLRDISTTLSILDAENSLDFNTYNKWVDAASRTMGVIGAAFSGFNQGGQGAKAWRMIR